MRRFAQNDKFTSLLFGLTDKSGEFRNRWRRIAGMAVWLLLSGFATLLTILGVTSQIHAVIIIGMSLIKYISLLAVVYSLSKKIAARCLDDIYNLNNEDIAASYLEEVVFGFGREKITINDGKINEKDKKTSLTLIGGPGSIQVNLDSVVLLEKVNGDLSAIYPRKELWKLGRFEHINEVGKSDDMDKHEYAIINLRDQFISGVSVKSRTKDGMLLEAEDIKVKFSISRRQNTKSNNVQGDEHLFDERAIRALVYNQSVITPKSLTPYQIEFPWDTTVVPFIILELEKIIASYTLNEIITIISQKEASNVSTNNQIIAQFFEKTFREKAANLGVFIQQIDIGRWQFPSGYYENREIINLINNVIVSNYEKSGASRVFSLSDKEKDKEKIVIAHEMLKAFREELIEAKRIIVENDSVSSEEKKCNITNINKALHNINTVLSPH